MKKKLLLIAASALACACLAAGLAACDNGLTHHAAIAPTCTTRGNEEYWSDANGNIFSDAKGKNALEAVPSLAALGHDWDEQITKAATCTEAGSMTYACKREGCDTKQEGVRIDPLGHDYTIKTEQEATCTADGKAVRTCSRGDTANEEITMPKGHSWGLDNVCKDCKATLEYDATLLRFETYEEGGVNVGVIASVRDESATEIVVPYGYLGLPVTEVSFANAAALESLSIPSSLENIATSAFSGCTALKSITLNGRNSDYFSLDGVLYVRGNEATEIVYVPLALEGEVELVGGVTAIPAEAFLHRTALTSVTIPASVTSFGYDAFYGCSALETVKISNLAAWCGARFANIYANPLSVGADLLLGGTALEALTIPAGVTEISSYAFYGFKTASVSIPKSVANIGAYAFCNNTALATITYAGTFEEWNAVLKADAWNRYTPETYTLVCTDGTYTRTGTKA